MMEGTRWLAGVVAEATARLEELVLGEAALWDEGDLLEVERRLQQVFRQVGSVIVSGVLTQRAQGPAGEATSCAQCGRRLHLVGRERERTVLGLVGEYRFARPTFPCAACHAGQAPLDAVLGLGAARLSPGLAQVVGQAAQQAAFDQASACVQGSLGVYVDGETVRRLAEELGRLIEHDQANRAQWAVPAADVPACVLVETDGVHPPLLDGYHESKVGCVAALGPEVRTDPETGRATLVLQPATFCVGLESVEDFLPRLTREAARAGVGRGVRQVVVLGDGAKWILPHLQTQFRQPGVEVIAIVDFYHAVEQLAEVATAVYGPGTLPARTWLAEQRHALLHQGAAPVLQAIAACTGLDEQAADVVRRTHDYFATRVVCLDYPRFIARHLPIGSGAIESACKTLITHREKGAGMRWTAAGAQHIANLRALYHCAQARWDAFWASRPLARVRRLPALPSALLDRAAPAPAAPALATGEASALPPDTRSSLPTPPAALTQRIATAGKPWGKGQGYWGRISISHKRSA
jgi:hypothetical protein